MADEFAGRTVVITGAARGQGAAEAEILVREGAHVIGADILDDEGRALAARLTASGPGHDGVPAPRREQRGAVGGAGGVPGGDRPHWTGSVVHGLVNNAGVPYRARLLDMDVAGWDRRHRRST